MTQNYDGEKIPAIAAMSVTNAYAVAQTKIVKEKFDRRRLLEVAEIIAAHQSTVEEINRFGSSTKSTAFVDYSSRSIRM